MAPNRRISTGRRFAHAALQLLDWALPVICVACNQPLRPGQGLEAAGAPRGWCEACAAHLPGLHAPRCPVCAETSAHASTCGRCRRAPPAFDLTIALADYAPPLDRLIHAVKFARQSALAPALGRMLADRIARSDLPRRIGSPAVVVPLPLGQARLAGRGFNQSLLLAAPLARALGLRLERRLLRRVRDTPQVALLDAGQRGEALSGAFEAGKLERGSAVILVDDVMTTGATLHAAASALRRAGAGSVVNCVAARTLPPPRP